jgi:hypothetical protein
LSSTSNFFLVIIARVRRLRSFLLFSWQFEDVLLRASSVSWALTGGVVGEVHFIGSVVLVYIRRTLLVGGVVRASLGTGNEISVQGTDAADSAGDVRGRGLSDGLVVALLDVGSGVLGAQDVGFVVLEVGTLDLRIFVFLVLLLNVGFLKG